LCSIETRVPHRERQDKVVGANRAILDAVDKRCSPWMVERRVRESKAELPTPPRACRRRNNQAVRVGHKGELGVVKAGALANLLLVDGNPLADTSILVGPDRFAMIMKDGKMHRDPRARVLSPHVRRQNSVPAATGDFEWSARRSPSRC
jgi:hypothetical protein